MHTVDTYEKPAIESARTLRAELQELACLLNPSKCENPTVGS